MLIPSAKEMIIMILVVVIIGTPTARIVEAKLYENSSIEDLRIEVGNQLVNVLPSSEVTPHMVKGVSSFITLNPIGALANFWDLIFSEIMYFLPSGMPNPFR